MITRIFVPMLPLVLLATPFITTAQTASLPIIIVADGDLWMWDGDLTPLTQNGHVTDAVMSPNGTHLAYHALSPVTLDALERVGGFSGYAPDDIHVIGVDGADHHYAASQPTDASLFADDGTPDNAWVRSQAAWSPDGTQIAWTEYNLGQINADMGRLMIYDLNTATVQTIASPLPDMQAAGPPPIDVRWGTTSLVLWMWSYRAADDSSGSAFWFYDTDGTRLAEQPITPEQFRELEDIAWVNEGQGSVLGLFYVDGSHELIAPSFDTVMSYPTSPTLISNHALHNSVALTYKINPNAKYQERTIWTATYPDGDSYTLPYRGEESTIAPDGEAVAFVEDNMLTIWSRGTTTAHNPGLERIDSVIWGATAWRDGEPYYNCGVMPPSRLSRGMQARVIPGTSPNNLRASFPSGEVVAQIPPGEVFRVISGPVCMAGHHWWQVDYNGVTGWTAEVGSGEYWIEAAN